MFDSNLNVFYSSGTGGFYFLHSLLFEKKHYCFFDVNKDGILFTAPSDPHPDLRVTVLTYNDIKDPSWPSYEQYYVEGNCGNLELIEAECKWALNPEVSPTWFDKQVELIRSYQWSIDPVRWKNTEIPLFNDKTLTTKCAGRELRIFLVATLIDHWFRYPGKKVVLFTDLKTQLRMLLHKRAWMYNDAEKHPISITKELLRSAKTYNGHTVSANTFEALQHADHVVYLQDFVKSMLSNDASESQREFTRLWLNLHPPSLLQRCNLT